MEGMFSFISDILSTIGGWFAAGNFSGLSPAQRAEAIKHMAGFAAGVATMPQRAGMGFVEGKVAALSGRALPTSPQNIASGLVRWQLDMASYISSGLSGDQAAAERAVQGVGRLGDYMAGAGTIRP